MGKIESLMKEGKISRINELELERYVNFFSESYRDNLEHSEANMVDFPRWSIISGYYAMHDITKLLLAKNFRIKIDFEVHKTTIAALRQLIKNKQLLALMDKGHKEFLSLANDLAEAKKERVKAQYYTGTQFMHEEYLKRAKKFHGEVVLKYLEKMEKLLK